MGLYFRKSLRVGPLRLTASKRGLSASAGPRGAKVGASTSGRRWASLSRSGLFWRKRL
jgi:hypothetical protein